MRKLLLLCSLLIFACSSEDSSDTNDSTNQKKMIGLTHINPCEGCEGENGIYNYTNNKLTYVDGEYFLTYENGEYWDGYPSPRFYTVEYLSNSIRLNIDGYVIDIPINDNGTINSNDIEFNNGFLHRLENKNYYWNNGNLSYYDWVDEEGAITHTQTIEYSEHPDLSGHLGLSLATDYLFFIPEVMYNIIGLYGNSTSNLPYKVSYSNNINDTTERVYSYVFDDDGYPVQIIENRTSVYQDGSTYENIRRYQLTYTN